MPGSIGEGDIVSLYVPSRFDVSGSLDQKREVTTKDSGSWRGFSAVSQNDEFGGVYNGLQDYYMHIIGWFTFESHTYYKQR